MCTWSIISWENISKGKLLDQKISKHVRIINIHYQFPFRKFMEIYAPLSTTTICKTVSGCSHLQRVRIFSSTESTSNNFWETVGDHCLHALQNKPVLKHPLNTGVAHIQQYIKTRTFKRQILGWKPSSTTYGVTLVCCFNYAMQMIIPKIKCNNIHISPYTVANTYHYCHYCLKQDS